MRDFNIVYSVHSSIEHSIDLDNIEEGIPASYKVSLFLFVLYCFYYYFIGGS